MKRILLLIGLGLVIWGVLGLNELKRQRSAIPETKPGYGIPEKDRENLAKDNTIAIAMIVVGGILFLWGLTPSSKPKPATQTVTVTAAPAPAPAPDPVAIPFTEKNSSDSIAQLERLAKLKEQGVLTEEEFQKEKVKILGQV